MSVIPASRLSRADLTLLGNNIAVGPRRVAARRPRDARTRELGAVNRSLATLGERVATLQSRWRPAVAAAATT